MNTKISTRRKDRKEGKVVKEEEHKQGELTDSEMKSLIYSDARQVFKVYKQYYKEAPLSQNYLEWDTLVTIQRK